jgi:nicotinate-nucleotide adenylyltransferase
MRLGCLGGSFDPVHRGHLALAAACREAAELDEVLLVVAGSPPHKLERALAPARHRAAMAWLASRPHPWLDVDDREVRREGPCYTIDTVRELRRERPGARVFWIIGTDTLAELGTWRSVSDLSSLADFLPAVRPGHDPEAALDAVVPPGVADYIRRSGLYRAS